eukprot:2352959-Rhodomonas_salina.1
MMLSQEPWRSLPSCHLPEGAQCPAVRSRGSEGQRDPGKGISACRRRDHASVLAPSCGRTRSKLSVSRRPNPGKRPLDSCQSASCQPPLAIPVGGVRSRSTRKGAGRGVECEGQFRRILT